MGKSTHFIHSTSRGLRVGGVPGSLKGAQEVIPGPIPNNFFPVNLPAATNGAPTQADCNKLLDTLAPLVAALTIQQSTALATAYRTVQSNVAFAGNFTVNGVSTASTTFFDQGYLIGESVAVDVVNKTPALGYDLAVRLARMASVAFDRNLVNLYGASSNAPVGTAATTPTSANITSALGSLPVTGEPVIGYFKPAVLTAMEAGLVLPLTSYSALVNGTAPIGVPASNSAPSAANRSARFLASDSIAVTGVATPATHNLVALPSFSALATADMGTATGTTSTTGYLTGQTLYRTSVAVDPEFATPQLSLQLVISNTGAGVQTVYVNAQFAAICINPANGVVILA